MNEQLTHTNVRTTQFADGLPRRSWTVAEFEKAAMLGLFAGDGLEDERLELLGGEILPMPPKGRRHELLRTELGHKWSAGTDRKVKIASETPLTLDNNSQPQPDLLAYPASLFAPDLTAENVLFVVEIADTSITKVIGHKAQLYAAAGVRDYWVINAATLVTTIFRDPTADGYQSRTDIAPDKTLTPLDAPELALTLKELGI